MSGPGQETIDERLTRLERMGEELVKRLRGLMLSLDGHVATCESCDSPSDAVGQLRTLEPISPDAA